MKGLAWVFGAVASVCSVAAAPATVKPWSSFDVGGKAVQVPEPGRASVVLFYRAGQVQSAAAADQLKAVMCDPEKAGAQVLVVLSGATAKDDARKLVAEARCPWSVVPDADYAASGGMGVHVWPTTLVVGKDGKLLAHLAGLPKTYTRDVDAHVAFAAGRIDAKALEDRLNNHETVVDSNAQSAHRHVEVAQRLMDKGLTNQAQVELDQAIKRDPNDAAVRLAVVESLLSRGEAAKALETLNAIEEPQRAKLPAWQISLYRGRALLGQGKLDEAEAALADATKLSPTPAEGYYHLGVVSQQKGDWKKAAEMYRKAFEATPGGKRMGTTTAAASK